MEKKIKDLDAFLEAAGIQLTEYMPEKPRPFRLSPGGTMNLSQVIKRFLDAKIYDYPEIMKALSHETAFLKLLMAYAKEKGIESEERSPSRGTPEQQAKVADLVLYKDISFTMDKEPKYFTGTKDGRRSSMPAHHYVSVLGIKDPEIQATPVILEYSPRSPLGINMKKTDTREILPHMNSYIPPEWMQHEGDLPDELPPLFKKLVDHVFPTEEGREFFFHWVYTSLVSRAETYLILQGKGAVGKNRIKIHLRALHGHLNSSDGKKSTLTGNFNNQLGENTLLYFDEIKFTEAEENVMKEVPNGTLSIEKKFENSTQSTRIYCSLVLANNKERDNFIAFDARKFCPVELNTISLLDSMTSEEVAEMSSKVEFHDHKDFDIAYIAQIGRWILKHGQSDKWVGCEYRGPRFWALANASMSQWQKKLLQFIFHPPELAVEFISKKKFKYSEVLESYKILVTRKDRVPTSMVVDFSNAQHFFDIYRDLRGDQIFKTRRIPKDPMGDFNITILKDPYMGEDREPEEIQTDRPEDLL